MLAPPIEPMLAKPLGSTIPIGPGVQFEPKWDGFRALVFWDGNDVVLQGRGRGAKGGDAVVDLAYAFPEIVDAIRTQLPADVVLDGEIVVEHAGRLDSAS